MSAAFIPRQTENYLSVNWLEYFGENDLSAAVEQVQEIFRRKEFRMRPNGRFAVLHVGAAKMAVQETVQRVLSIDRLPLGDDPSHAGIFGYASEDLAVAVELRAVVKRRDVHSVVTRAIRP